MKTLYPSKKEDWFPVEVYGQNFTQPLNNMFQFIIKNNLQKWFTEFEPETDKGFMRTSDPTIDIISKGVDNDGHSGATFSYSLRIMQDIFKNNNLEIQHEKRFSRIFFPFADCQFIYPVPKKIYVLKNMK